LSEDFDRTASFVRYTLSLIVIACEFIHTWVRNYQILSKDAVHERLFWTDVQDGRLSLAVHVTAVLFGEQVRKGQTHV
jgi:hypothetical protein